MYDAPLVPVGDGGDCCPKKAHTFPGAEIAAAGVLGERLPALNKLHHEKRNPAALDRLNAGGMNLGDCRMAQPAEDLGLVFEAFGSGCGEKTGPNQLHRNRPLGAVLPAFENPPHAPLADQADQRDIAQPGAGAAGIAPSESVRPQKL